MSPLLPDTVTAVYLTGPPGSGKSQLAREFGARFFDDVHGAGKTRLVATLQAERPEALLKSLKEICGALGAQVQEGPSPSKDVFTLLRRYSQGLKNVLRHSAMEWLLIIDNLSADCPQKEFWPQPGENSPWGGGKVLITTQDNELVSHSHSYASPLSLAAGMEPAVALEVLVLVSGLEADEHATAVAQRLNYYPLSLACAAVYVCEMRESRPAANFGWKNYLSNLTNYFEHLEYSEYTEHNPSYPRSMLSAAIMAAQRMADTSDVLRATFEFLSHCALVQPVPLDAVADYVLRVTRALVPDTVKSKVARCSLLVYPRAGEKGIEVIQCHQVMRFAFVRLTKKLDGESFSPESSDAQFKPEFQEKRRLEEVLRSFNNTYKKCISSLDQRAISERILLSPHLQECIGTSEKKSWTDSICFVEALVHLADGLVHVAGASDYQRVSLLERAYHLRKDLGMEDVSACRLLCDLGYTYREAGQLDKVVPILEEANKIAESLTVTKECLEQRSRLLNVLSWTYRERFQLELAKEYMLMCVEVTKQAYGEKHVEVVERLCNLGIILHDRWENEDAIKVLHEAKALSATLKDSEGFIQAQVANYTAKVQLRWSLGLIYTPGQIENARSRLEISKGLHEEALGIYQSLHGDQHKFNAGVMMTYGLVLMHLGELDSALENCKKALQIFKDSGHIAWPRAATWLADVFLARKEVTKARELLQEVTQAHSDLQLPVSPGAFHPRALLAEAYAHMGEREKGGKMLRECLQQWTENELHPGHYWMVRAHRFLEQLQL